MNVNYNSIYDFSKRLEKSRKKLNMSQNELSCKLGFTRSYINQLEHGYIFPSLKSLIKISDFLNTSIDYLITGSNLYAQDKLDIVLADLTQKQRDFLAAVINALI